MIKALEVIHQKVKSAFENDTKTFGAQAIMMGGIPPLPLSAAAPPPQYATPYHQHPAAAVARYPGQQNTVPPYTNFYPTAPMFPPFYPQQQQQQQNYISQPPPPQQQQQNFNQQQATTPPSSQQQQSGPSSTSSHQQLDYDFETVYLYVPNQAVGAIIGTKGQFIKNLIKLSGASIKITPLSPEESKIATERQVVIQGARDNQSRAQWYIYEKIRQERILAEDNLKLRAEIHVPSNIVGRIIGKSGKNVRELQRATGCTIKLPEDANIQTQTNTVVVRIHGTFQSSQLAQQRIQLLISQALRGPINNNNNNNNNRNNLIIMNQPQQQQHNRQMNGGNSRKHSNRQQNGSSSSYHQQQNESTTNSTPTETTPTTSQQANTSINNNEATPSTPTTPVAVTQINSN
jgi:transcription antitermination factor NusA-like protein